MDTVKKAGTTLLLISAISGLSGCATRVNRHPVLPQGGPTMSEIYHRQDYGGQLDNVRSELSQGGYRVQQVSAQSVISNAPKLLPNPLITIYVYPHFDGDDQDYVPGHLAYTQLYKEAHFALPGEPTELE